MKKLNIFTLLLILFAASFTGCKDDEETPAATPETGQFNINFNHVWGMNNLPFQMNKMIKHPMTGDSLEFTTYKYYISNIKLKDANGDWWSEDESYHLVDLSLADGNILNIQNVPAGEYSAIQYTHGVDSVRNFSGAQEGALSILNQMFWSWNTGYIMVKAEGNSPQSKMGHFKYHLGGYEGENNIVTNKMNEFGSSTLHISDDDTHTVNMSVNPAKMWHTVGTMSGKKTMIMMPGDTAKIMATDLFGATAFLSID
ncbi:MAG: MbnP family protein [Bacteroidia bacterium]